MTPVMRIHASGDWTKGVFMWRTEGMIHANRERLILGLRPNTPLPGPVQENPILARQLQIDHLFGFESVDHYREWFPHINIRRALFAHGDVAMTIFLVHDVLRFCTQCAFTRGANIISMRPATESECLAPMPRLFPC